MAESTGETSNPDLTALFDTLADWEAVLQAQNIDFAQFSSSADENAEASSVVAAQHSTLEPQR